MAEKKQGKKQKGAEPKADKKGGGKKKPERETVEAPTPRLLVKYREEILPKLMEHFGIKNRMAVPKIEKIIINSGVKQGDEREKRLATVVNDMGLIAGQKAVVTIARRSVSGFRLREGDRIGAKVTLRRAKMYEFLDRLIAIAIPRVRDFRGLNPKSFDGRGNYTFGVTEQTIFPEVDLDNADYFFGMDVTIVTTAPNDDQGRELLRSFGFPFGAK